MTAVQLVRRPPASADWTSRSRYRDAGMLVAVTGLMVVMVATAATFVVGDDPIDGRQDTVAWAFGLNFAGLNLIKIGIALTLMGIVIRLWMRVESVKTALPRLKAAAPDEAPRYGDVKTSFGPAEVTAKPAEPLWIHKMAEALWTPMILMGPMIVGAGAVLGFVQAGETPGSDTFGDLGAVTAGASFLGEVVMLGGISFILGTILSSLRKGGGEVQHSLGVPVKTLKVPLSAWAFVGLMMMGMMVGMAQFALYLVTTGLSDPGSWFAWLAPLGMFSIGLMAAGIVLALYTIGTVLGFQFDRLRQIIVTGR